MSSILKQDQLSSCSTVKHLEMKITDYPIARYRVLADIALVNRQRRNYRLIRDWEGGRPWYDLLASSSGMR